MDIENRIISILSNSLKTDSSKINGDTLLKEDLGVDSLDYVELLFSMEDEFKIEIPEEHLSSFQKVSDIAAYVGKATVV